MALTINTRFRRAWNAFMNRDPTNSSFRALGSGHSIRPDRSRFTRGNERSIVTSVLNRIALDVAAISVQHVQLDSNDRFTGIRDSGLNDCLSISANMDQTGRSFIQDVAMSMMDEGVVALVPVDTDIDPSNTSSFDIITLRTGRITQWYPNHVRVQVYNELNGLKEEITLPKANVAIVENPFYAVMNEPNSIAQRLIRKLNLLDAIDEQSGSGKLDMIIQLPYAIKSDLRREGAERRRKDIEQQLTGSKYGIAYMDSTEKIIQLNRSVENNLMGQIEFLIEMFYSQLGITKEIMNGTADPKTMQNYYSRTIEPILAAIIDEMKRKFLTKTARTQGQSIMFFRDPFKLLPPADMAEIADKYTRNEISTPNEMRQIIGMKPADDPKADELRNRNISAPAENNGAVDETEEPLPDSEEAIAAEIEKLENEVNQQEEIQNE